MSARTKYGKVSRVQFAHRGGETWNRLPSLRMSCCNLGDEEGPGLASLWKEEPARPPVRLQANLNMEAVGS